MGASGSTLTCPECGKPCLRGGKFCAYCGALRSSHDIAMELAPGEAPLPAGTLIGSYRLISVLGEGGMGRVYLAEHIKLGRRVAIKKLRHELASNPAAVARFFAEARAVNRISHDNIVEITDLIEQPRGDNYIVMELLKGEDLGQRLVREHTVPLLAALEIARQVASALSAVHAAGIIHRDLKPDNIFLVERHGNPSFVKILDFGVAKLADAGSGGIAVHTTAAGQIIGTPEYMSPEQASGAPVDYRTDIYALGVILYEMILGALPFQARSFGELMIKHMTEPVELPARQPGLPPGVQSARDRLLLDLLAKDPHDRPVSMADVEQRIRAQLDAMDLPQAPVRRVAVGSNAALPLGPLEPPPATATRPRSSSRSAETVARMALVKRPAAQAAQAAQPAQAAQAASQPAIEVATPRAQSRIEVVTPSSAPRVSGPDLEDATRPRSPARVASGTSRDGEIANERARREPAGTQPGAASSANAAPAGGTGAAAGAGIAERTREGSRSVGAPAGPAAPTAAAAAAIDPPVVREAVDRPAPAGSVAALPAVAPPAPRRSGARRAFAIGAALGAALTVVFASVLASVLLRQDELPAGAMSAPLSPEVQIKFVSVPDGATVRIVGAADPLGVTPFRRSFPRESRMVTVEFSRPGFAPATQDISLADDDAAVAQLAPLPAAVPDAAPGAVAQPVAAPAPPAPSAPPRAEPSRPRPPARPARPPAPDHALDRNGTLDVFAHH
ncbi:MAG TPA: serine/threonine-protein kinase [Kofleriaceae bacterium]|jgi:serine/threonine-protein kinase|nr:serine/threonine-protein kinase [Kofleriaceae bacterium]